MNVCVIEVYFVLFFQFIIEDMKQQQTNKHSNLHREDQHITVEELWKGWKTSEGETERLKTTRIVFKMERWMQVSIPNEFFIENRN